MSSQNGVGLQTQPLNPISPSLGSLKTFGSEQFLKHHKKEVHYDPINCSICGKKVKKIKSHMESVHLDPSEMNFKCVDCGKGFMHIGKLKIHQINVLL